MRFHSIFVVSFLLLIAGCIADSQLPFLESAQKLTLGTGHAGAQFGYSVSISEDGNVALIGANWEDAVGADSGAAYIYKYNNGQYEQLQNLTASDAQPYDDFGCSVSISRDGQTAIVGAVLEDEKGSKAGAAYIYKYSSGKYVELQKLTASDGEANDQFGYSLSLSKDGSIAIVGSFLDDDKGSNAGAAFIFKKNSSGLYEEKQKLLAEDGSAGANFGWSVSLSEDGLIVLIGAYADDGMAAQAGASYVFKYNITTMKYDQKQKLVASDATGDDYFGYGVALSEDGSIALISAVWESDKGYQAGASYVFKYNTATMKYDQKQKLFASNAGAGDFFGSYVGISDNGLMALIGAYNEDGKGTNSGAAYLFIYNATSMKYEEHQKVNATDGQAGDYFGYALAISGDGNAALVGAYAEDEKGSDAGAAYIGRLTCANGLVYSSTTSLCVTPTSTTPTPTTPVFSGASSSSFSVLLAFVVCVVVLSVNRLW